MTTPTKVPFVDLTRLHAPLKADILARISSIIDRSAFVLGPEVEAFEKEFAAFIGSKHSVGVSSGLDALKLALLALDVGPGDEVITSASTFIATAYAASQVGAKPVLVDCEPTTWNLDPAKLEKAITSKTKCILPVHLYGQAAEMDAIMKIAAKHGIPVVEDCAQSHGSLYQGRTTGTFGVMGCFSFYPGKNLGAMGEGGGITTSDDTLRAKLRILRDVGQKEKYNHTEIGHNSRLHTVQAAILSAKLPSLKQVNEHRAQVARQYAEILSDVRGMKIPTIGKDRTHVFHLYVITLDRAEDRDALKDFLGDRGIQSGIHYPTPIHLQECYRDLGYPQGSFPVAEKLAKSALSLPIFYGMTSEETSVTGKAIREFFKC